MSLEYYSVIDEKWHVAPSTGREQHFFLDESVFYQRYFERGFIRIHDMLGYDHKNKPAFEAYIKSLEERVDD